MHEKTHLEINFIYLGNKKIYCTLKHADNLYYFPQNSVYFIILSFSVQILHFFINQVLKFKYPSG